MNDASAIAYDVPIFLNAASTFLIDVIELANDAVELLNDAAAFAYDAIAFGFAAVIFAFDRAKMSYDGQKRIVFSLCVGVSVIVAGNCLNPAEAGQA